MGNGLSEQAMMLQIGDQFDHFQISGHIAQGGMSDIYRAFDLLTGKDVVLKVPDRMMIGDPAQYERFQREMEVMEMLHHPAIQKGLGSGRYNNTPYLVTELITGESMRDLIKRATPMSPDDALALTRKIAEGVAYCHDNGIIHRDLKPENILITESGQPVIMDFGLALTKDSFRVTYSNLSGAAGTPDYMAPEQIEGARGDKRTDLYAVGTMLFELLAGRTPFTGDNNLAVMAQHLRGAIPRLDKERPGISPQLAAVVARSMQREPNARQPDLHAFLYDLDHLDGVDVKILETGTGKAVTASIWSQPAVKSIGFALIILVAMVIIALGLQALHH